MADFTYFDRDLSWLSFNERVLQQAERADVPLLEKLNFLAIFSSNLDEFYRVRMPVLKALTTLGEPGGTSTLQTAIHQISRQQELFGKIFNGRLVPLLKKNGAEMFVNKRWPGVLNNQVQDYFFSQVMAFLQPVELTETGFFPKNNQLYFLITIEEKTFVLNIPSDQLPRFFKAEAGGNTYILVLDDIIRYNLKHLFKNEKI